jgi:toxin CcdB
VALQFDVAENLAPDRTSTYPLLLVLQHDRAGLIATVIVAPLVPADIGPLPSRLQPLVTVRGRKYVVLVSQLAAVPKRAIGHAVGNVMEFRYEIVAALDLLFTGV